MRDYALLLIADILLAVIFVFNKLYQKREGNSLLSGLRFNIFVGLFITATFFAVNGFQLHMTSFSFLMVLGMSVFDTSYSLVGFKILKSGSIALYSMFVMAGGMILPYLWGLLFLGEPFSWLRTFGLLILIAAIIFSNIGDKHNKTNVKMLLLCVLVFVLNGFVSVFSKLHQIETVQPTISAIEFTMFSGMFKLVMSLVAYGIIKLVMHKKQTREDRTPNFKFLIPITLATAVSAGISYALQLMGASNLPATVLYPLITGGSMIFTAIAGILCFKEKLSKKMIVSLSLCFVGCLM